MEIPLNRTDRAILREIDENGRGTVTLFAGVVDMSRTYAGDRVRRLREHELLEEVAPNLYDLTENGRQRLQEVPA